MSGSGGDDAVSNLTPPTPTSSALNSISPFLTQAPGIGQCPIYASTLHTGNSLLCSPALLGQTMNPWRQNLGISLGGVPNPTVSSTSSQQQQQQLPTSGSTYLNLTQLAQLQNVPGGLVCAPFGAFIQNPQAAAPQQDTGKRTPAHDFPLKRRSESSHSDMDAHKRSRLSDPSPHSPSLASSSSSSPSSSSPHPSTPTPTFQHKQHSNQRSPVVKVVPYTSSLGGPLLIHTAPSNLPLIFPAVNLSSMASTQQRQATPITTTAAVPSQQQQQQVVVNLQHIQPRLQQQQIATSSPSFIVHGVSAGGNLVLTEQAQSLKGSPLPLNSGSILSSGITTASSTNTSGAGANHTTHHQQQPHQYHHPQQHHHQPSHQLVLPHSMRHLLSGMRLVLLKCLGPISDSIVSQNHLVLSNFLQDIYRQSYFTTSSFSEPPLSPESCCLLTICYLSSLQRGEQINVEGLRTMIHHAQLGEMEWLHYYKKHKKMSESSFVQAQLIHLSRVAVYPVQGKVRVVISNQSLNEGVVMALQRLAQLWTTSEQNFPEYWVVLAVRPSSTIDFCVLITDPLQVQLLLELKMVGADSRTKRQLQAQSSRVQTGSNPGSFPQQGTKALANSHSGLMFSSGSKLHISKDLLLAMQSFQQRLDGGVLIPFYQLNSMQNRNSDSTLMGTGLVRMERREAEELSPTYSHVVEHKPRGPFQDQYNVAMHMLQKILSYWGNQAKIEEYQRVDFRVLCPLEASFVSQTMREVMDSGLVEHLKLREGGKKVGGGAGNKSPVMNPSKIGGSVISGVSKEVESRIVCCASDDTGRFNALLKEIEADTSTLYIVVAENGHMTSHVMPESQNSSSGGLYSDDAQLLCHLPNCILVNVSSHPYSLQTNRSFISFVNEIHWPISSDKSSLHFCSAANFRSNRFQNLESEFEYGVRFREDQCFEEMFHEFITNQTSSPSHFNIATIRTQLLLNQYVSALLATVSKCTCASPSSPADSASPKTQDIINRLVHGPLGNPRGHGSMVIVRSHDKALGKLFYHKVRQVRDALGLNYRFEVLYDDASSFLSISEIFHKRLSQWKGGRHLNGVSTRPQGGGRGGGRNEQHMVASYKDLENLPCLVVLAGECRAGLSFPSSLCCVDLRMCYMIGTMTRLHYEYDTSFFNGYYKIQNKPAPSLPLPSPPVHPSTATKDRKPAVDAYNGDSDDVEVFDGNLNNGVAIATSHYDHTLPMTTTTTAIARTGSSSSSRKSSYNDSLHDRGTTASGDSSLHPLLPPTQAQVLPRSTIKVHNSSLAFSLTRPTVVEWRPEDHSDENSPPTTPQDEVGGSLRAIKKEEEEMAEEEDVTSPNEQEEFMDDVYSSTVTVTIDVPGDEDDPMTRYLGGNMTPQGNYRPGAGVRECERSAGQNGEGCDGDAGGLWSLFGGEATGGEQREEEEEDLYECLNEVDLAEEEDSDTPPPVRLCLLSRQYYCIWCSRSAQQHLLLQPCPGISWHGGQKRPPLFDPDPRQQSAHYRKWTKPWQKEVRNQYDRIMKMANKSSRRRFLLTGPPQVGKTGAWIMMIKLLHDHLRSSLGVMVESTPLPLSTFVPFPPPLLPPSAKELLPGGGKSSNMVQNLTPLSTFPPSTSKHSPIVPLDYLHDLFKNHDNDNESKAIKPLFLLRDTPTQSCTEASQHGVTTSATDITGHMTRHEVVCLPVSPYMSYDFTHSCNECSKYVRGNPLSPAEFLTSSLPPVGGKNSGGGGQGGGGWKESLIIKWCIPASQQKHCIINSSSKTLERLKLPVMRLKGERISSQIMTPIFIPTLGRDSSGLFNLFHGQFYNLHVLVTSDSEFGNYCKAWPNHIIMALPDKATMGLGSMYHYIKEYCQHNLHLNSLAIQHESPSRIVWPFVAIISDNIVMMKKLESDTGSYVDVSLSYALQSFEQSTECFHYSAMGALPWNKQLELEQEERQTAEGGEREGENRTSAEISCLSTCDLSHDFIILNLGKLADTHYNYFSFNSAEVDFNLQLKACRSRTKLRTELVFVKKHLPNGGNPYPLHADVSGLCSEVDKLVISLHHDSSSHLPHPGPYLMEHYLLYKGQVLFPYAHSPHFPVLAIDNYISLGPHTHVSFVKSEILVKTSSNIKQNGASEEVFPANQFAIGGSKTALHVEDLSQIKFGGLLLYLCEEKLSVEHFKKLNFVCGASLCLVTQDCKSLVREVARLDLEEKWKFRLRDEYQTACGDDMTPLFFLIGRFEG